MTSWGDIYNKHLRRGDDHGYAAYAADQWVKRQHEGNCGELKHLRAEVATLRAALKPFADAAADFITEKHDMTRAIVTLGDLRAAAAAIREGENRDD